VFSSAFAGSAVAIINVTTSLEVGRGSQRVSAVGGAVVRWETRIAAREISVDVSSTLRRVCNASPKVTIARASGTSRSTCIGDTSGVGAGTGSADSGCTASIASVQAADLSTVLPSAGQRRTSKEENDKNNEKGGSNFHGGCLFYYY